MSRKGLQAFLTLLGCVAVIFGGLAMVLGAASVPRPGSFTSNLDSELRFFATWYVIVGVLLLRTVRDVESQATIIRTIAAGAFLAGCARALGWAAGGAPDTQFAVLMVIELAIPIVVVPWQSAVARAAPSSMTNGTLPDVRRAL
jgi:hypothetical protein